MKMSDRDFDQLFNTKLADIEAEPSPMVWDNIAAELDGPAKKRLLGMPFIRIAASIVALLGASLFFIRPSVHKVILHGSGGNTARVEQSPEKASNKAIVATVGARFDGDLPRATTSAKRAKNTPVGVAFKEIKNAVDTTQILAEVNKKLADNANANAIALQQQNAQQAAISSDIPKPKVIVPDKEAILANNIPAAQKSKEIVKKKRIHSLGDLLNVVIAQVDKRKDKIVEFTNDRDDDSFSITGINLGVVSAKKDK